MLACDRAAIAALWREFHALLNALAASPLPIAVAITGHAPAGGTVLTLFCDRRVMPDGDFKIGLNEVQVGLPLLPVILAALRRLVGPRHAEHLAVGGLLISPREALAVGPDEKRTSVAGVDPAPPSSGRLPKCRRCN